MMTDGLAERLADRLARGRAAAEARMLSRGVVKRRSGTTTNADGFKVPAWSTRHTDLPLRLAGAPQSGSGTRTVTRGGAEVQLAVRVASVPAATGDLRDGDIIEITAGENAGVFVEVVEAAWQDQATARRLPVIETAQPEGWSA